MKRKYQSELLKSCHQEAQNLLAVGAISEAEMREFDEDCLVSGPKRSKKAHSSARQPPASIYAGPQKV